MKKTIIMLALLIMTGSVFSQSSSSQNGNSSMARSKNLGPDERAVKEADKVSAQLGLTAEQKASWETAARERIGANKPLREKMQGATTKQEKQELHRQVKSNGDVFDKKVAAILTPDQKQKFDQERASKKSRAGRKGIR